MRLKKGLTVKELMRKTGVHDTKILHFENLIINSIKPKELKKLTEEFECSKEDIFKPVKVEKIGTSNRNVEYKVISYDVSEDELKKEIYSKYQKILQYRRIGGISDYKAKTSEKSKEENITSQTNIGANFIFVSTAEFLKDRKVQEKMGNWKPGSFWIIERYMPKSIK